MKLTPDTQDALLAELEERAAPATVTDTNSLTTEHGRMLLAERFGKYRFVVELKSELLSRRKK